MTRNYYWSLSIASVIPILSHVCYKWSSCSPLGDPPPPPLKRGESEDATPSENATPTENAPRFSCPKGCTRTLFVLRGAGGSICSTENAKWYYYRQAPIESRELLSELNNHALLPCQLKKKMMDVDVRVFHFH